jgi:Tol biopolymer transport system component
MSAYFPRWSPDGTRIVFTGSEPGKASKAYVVAASGGVPEAVVPGVGPEFDAGWSSDGQSLVYADSVSSPKGGLHLLELSGRHVSAPAGSEGLFSPRWSPDGRFIAALTKDSMTLKIVDLGTGLWRDLVRGQGVAYPSWSKDSKTIYFRTPMERQAGFYRVRVADAKTELVTDAPIPRGLAASINGWWSGVDRDGTPIVLRDAGIQEIYALVVKWP